MNRNYIAYLLAGAAALSLCASAALATGTTGDGNGAGSAPVVLAEAESPARTGTAVPAAPAGGTEPESEPQPEPDPEGTVSFANLKSRVSTGSLNYRILQESIDSIKANDYEKMEEDMRDKLNWLADLQWSQTVTIPSVIGATAGPELGPSVQNIAAMSASATSASLKSSYDALREQYDDLREGKLQADMADKVRQLENTQNTIVMATENLFAQLKELDATDATLERSLAALDRQLRELELRYELGQVSALALKQAQAGRTSLASSRETMASTARTMRMNLNAMLGEELTRELTLGALPQVTDEQLSRMDLEADLAAAKKASFTLYDAQQDLDDARETYNDAGGDDYHNPKKMEYIQARHAWQAAQYTYEAAVQSFELSFRTLYGQIRDYRQVLGAARTALALERDNYAVDQLKYEQGTISQNALLTARDDLAAAQDKADTAQRDLFSAYHSYRWAVDYGILN